jgi:hypothetical protein
MGIDEVKKEIRIRILNKYIRRYFEREKKERRV